MDTRTLSFDTAYDSYFHELNNIVEKGMNVLEVGGGAHPSLGERSGVNYTIVDPDLAELEKAPSDVNKMHRTIQEPGHDQQYDLIISKMVLEHIAEPDAFHQSVFKLLKPGGKAVHFFACRNSLPAFVNRFLPEAFGEFILKSISNRALDNQPKYKAYYKRTFGPTKRQLRYLADHGFQIEKYYGFVGHRYLKSIPLFKQAEALYTSMLNKLEAKSMATVALMTVTKPT